MNCNVLLNGVRKKDMKLDKEEKAGQRDIEYWPGMFTENNSFYDMILKIKTHFF